MTRIVTLGLVIVGSIFAVWILLCSRPPGSKGGAVGRRHVASPAGPFRIEWSPRLQALLSLSNATVVEEHRKRPVPPLPILYTYIHPTTKVSEEFRNEIRLWMRRCVSRGVIPRLLTIRNAERHPQYRNEYGFYERGRLRASLCALHAVGGGILVNYKYAPSTSLVGIGADRQVWDDDYFYSEALMVAGRAGIEAHLNGTSKDNVPHAIQIAKMVPLEAITESLEKSGPLVPEILCPAATRLYLTEDKENGSSSAAFRATSELSAFKGDWIILIPGEYEEETRRLIRSNLERTVPIIPESTPGHNQLAVEYAAGVILPAPLEIEDQREREEEAQEATDPFMLLRYVDWMKMVRAVDIQIDLLES